MAQLLLVEDDAAIRSALIRTLTERGHAVTSMATAMSGLQHLLASPPDLILLDLGLPDVSGYEALRMMRAVSSVPVVIVTARDDEADIIRVLRGQIPMSQGKSPHIADLRRNLPRRLPLAFVSLTVGPHPQGLQALQLKKRAACRSLFSECAHGSPELRLT